MGIIRIMLFTSLVTGILAAHTWPRQSESQGETTKELDRLSKRVGLLSSLFSFKTKKNSPQLKTKPTPGSWESTKTQEQSMDDFLEELCQKKSPACGISYSGVMFSSGNWPCGRKCF